MLSAKQSLKGKLNNAIVKEYPELEDISITPAFEEQNLKSEKYGYNNVKVKAIPARDLMITPTDDSQEFEGLYKNVSVNGVISEEKTITPDFSVADKVEITGDEYLKKVTINKDENLIAENIRQGVTLNGVEGTMEGAWDSSFVVRTQYIFYGNTDLIVAPYFNTENVRLMEAMFKECKNLEKVPKYNMQKVETINQMFLGCSKVKELPEMNTSLLRDASFAFSGCKSLLKIPKIDLSKTTQMRGFAEDCSLIEDVTHLDLNNKTSLHDAFSGCTNLKNIPKFNVSSQMTNAWDVRGFVSGCPNLTEESLKNILEAMTTSSIASGSYKTLQAIGLTKAQVEICKTLPAYQAFIDAGWTTGY